MRSAGAFVICHESFEEIAADGGGLADGEQSHLCECIRLS